jgi:hypothetical protein
MCWNIVNTTTDEKIRLQAGALINDCTRHRIDLSTNGVVITDAINIVNGKMDHLNSKEKKLMQVINDNEEEEKQNNINKLITASSK